MLALLFTRREVAGRNGKADDRYVAATARSGSFPASGYGRIPENIDMSSLTKWEDIHRFPVRRSTETSYADAPYMRAWTEGVHAKRTRV